MDSSESSSKVIMSNKQLSDSVPQKQGDSDYDDDFEDADSNIRETSKDSSFPTSSPKVSGRKDVFHSGSEESDVQPEKGQREASGQAPTEKSVQPGDNSDHGKRQTSPHEESQSDESEPEPEEDPPEYNVKERLKELNAELASEPDPDNRQHRVGFKSELVDLVAPPPPEVSDDEETPRKDKENRDRGDRAASKSHVIERSGKFEVVGEHELTADERSMLNLPDEDDHANKNQQKHGHVDQQNQSEKHSRQPAPPAKPRPATASGNSRRNVHPAASQRPKTASQTESSSMLQNFDYKSRYGMSPSEKKKAQEQARLREERRKEEEEKKKKEEEEKQQEADECFVSWLKRKQEEKKRRKEKDEERKKTEVQEDKSQENEQAFHEWLKTKHNQHKKEKLLKKREEQEINDGYYVRSRDECDKAYKEWLKKKYAELKEKKKAEKHRNKSYKIQARRARKQMMMARVVRQSQAFRYVDYYGYRF